MTKDPVCGMQIDEQKAADKTVLQGITYFFCSSGCHKAFTADPDRYATAASTSQGGSHGQTPKR